MANHQMRRPPAARLAVPPRAGRATVQPRLTARELRRQAKKTRAR